MSSFSHLSPEELEEDKDFLRQIVARAYTEPQHAHKVLDGELLDSIVEIVHYSVLAWKDTAKLFAKNSDYYQGILEDIAIIIGEKGAFKADIPEHVQRIMNSLPRLNKF